MQAVAEKEKPKLTSFKAWLEAKPYWEQYLWKLHLEKEVLDEADIEKCYQYLLEDCNVTKILPGRTPVIFPVLDFNGSDAIEIKSIINKIDKLKDVNAIDDSCVIEFGKNLTIIYGDNGTGKSGIGRLLSNACRSRKPRKLLPNAHKLTYPVPRPSAQFHITDNSGLNVIKYSFGDNHPVLKAFAVFDHECALTHLNSENKVEFVPSKIKIFDEVFKSISAIESKLQKEVDSKKQENPTYGIFAGTSTVTVFLDSMSYKTSDKEAGAALKFSSADRLLLGEKKKELSKKMQQDVSAQKKLLQDEYNDLGVLKTLLFGQTSVLSETVAKKINDLLKDIKEKRSIANKLSIDSFNFAEFKHVGSHEWKSMILAAEKLYEKETASSGKTELEHCLLCRQPLADKEKTLFGNYWKFLKSTAETELAAARQTLILHLDALKQASVSWPTFSETEAAIKILKKDAPVDLENIKEGFKKLHSEIGEWIEKIKTEDNVVYVDPKIDLNPVDSLITKKKGVESKLVDPAAEINTLTNEIARLEQKKQASLLLPQIKKYLAWLRWENAVSSINLPAIRGNTTRKKTDIMDELVISQYVNKFNEETKRLDCNFGLKVESHGRDAATIKELKLDFAKGYSPSDILSEGEQTVSALADFLTEIKLDKGNSGIIFDDPVTSLDHERRSTIAKRLVEEAKDRQVVVLTHDIVFLLDLQYYAENETVNYISVSMRKVGDKVGLIKPELPWIALDVKKKTGYLKNELPALKKAETGDPDEYRNKVKLWYELLREAWERSVEERLFKGVVQRFNKSVQTQKLAKIEIAADLIKEITDGMSESSKWLHDMAAGVNPAVPKNDKLELEFKALESFITKCKPD